MPCTNLRFHEELVKEYSTQMNDRLYRTMMKALVWILVLFSLSFISVAEAIEDPNAVRKDNQVYSDARNDVEWNCDIYLAPAGNGIGWGVYAARDFAHYEVIEISPRFIPMQEDWYKSNVLDDYHYGYRFEHEPENESFGVTILGMAMWYNHGPAENQNVVFTNFGHEPVKERPWFSQGIGFAAKRDIKRGEELYSSYGVTDAWFTDRGLQMRHPPEAEPLSNEVLDEREKKYCSKIYGGAGHSTWHRRILPTIQEVGYPLPNFDSDRYLPLQDHPTAIAKEAVTAGQILDMAPALVIPLDQILPSPLAAFGIYWEDWDDEQKASIQELREVGAYRMKGWDTEANEIILDVMKYYEDAVVLPVAGSIGMVRKVGKTAESSNCRLSIISSTSEGEVGDLGSAGVVLQLIATEDIQAGEELRLSLPDSSSWDAKMNLLQHLAFTGQPIPKWLANSYDVELEPPPRSDAAGDEL